MANENQPKLEDKLLDLGSLTSISRNIDESREPSQRGQLYEAAAELIAGPRLIETEQGKRENLDYRNLIKELRYSPEYAQTLIQGNMNIKASEIKNEYETKKGEILKQIANLIDKRLITAKNKIEATYLLKPFLEDLMKIKEPTQSEANEVENRNFENRLKIPYAFDQIGSTEHYKDLVMRNILSNYIIEEKENDKVIYKVNKEKLSEITDNIISGAILYAKAKTIEHLEAIRESQAKQTQKE